MHWTMAGDGVERLRVLKAPILTDYTAFSLGGQEDHLVTMDSVHPDVHATANETILDQAQRAPYSWVLQTRVMNQWHSMTRPHLDNTDDTRQSCAVFALLRTVRALDHSVSSLSAR